MQQRKGLSRKAVYLATIVAMIGASAGFVMAGSFTSNPVTETGTWYSVQNSASAAFPTQPTVAFGAVPTTGCSSGTPTVSSGGSTTVILPASSSVSACTAGDFAQVFTLTTSATAATGSYPVDVYTTYTTTGSPIPGAASITLSLPSTLTSAATVTIYVDYGANSPPAGGIASLNLVLS